MKRMTTQQKIRFLQTYMRKWHKRWRQRHGENIVGFRIDKKQTNGIVTRNYAVIFQVKKKKQHSRLDKQQLIPSHLQIKFPDGIKRRIQTDVEETGAFKLYAGITSEVDSSYSNKFGTAGLFVTDEQQRVYVLTNYHVVAENMIARKQYYYRRPPAQTAMDVIIHTSPQGPLQGRFEDGMISHEIDAAFVELFLHPDPGMNVLPDHNRVKGKVFIRPYPPSFKGKKLKVYSYYNDHGRDCAIQSNAAIMHTGNPDIYFEELVQITPKITQGGDSGGAVLTSSFAMLGIIVGADNDYSYAIPFYKIEDFKRIFII